MRPAASGQDSPASAWEQPHLLVDWNWEANERCGWHPDHVTLGSDKKVHWVVQDECKLGVVHRWQAVPNKQRMSGSPFPSGKAVCACKSLAVQCPKGCHVVEPPSKRGHDP